MHEIEYFQTVPWNTITVTLYPYENVLWNPIEYSVGNLYPTEYSVGKKIQPNVLLDILYDTKVSIESNGIFCWIFLPTEYSIGYSVWHQSVNRIFFWIFYSIMFLLPTEYYVRFSIWHIRIPIEYSIEHPIEYSISWNSVIYDVIVDIQYDIRNSILKILLLFQNTHHYTSAFNWG